MKARARADGGRVAGDGAESVIRFPDALPGLEGAHAWQLVEHPEALPFLWLRSVDRPPLALLVVDPRVIRPDYAPNVSAGDLERIGLAPGAPRIDLVVVTLREGGRATANLRAPLLINPEKMLGAQVILTDPSWPLHHPIAGAGAEAGGTGRSRTCSSSAGNKGSRSSSGSASRSRSSESTASR
ncbi:MAG: flagellar assembly protein FliW [Acidobacteria bacterium]|nr:MAG: flagellar assembly protein FliW [Acidobacteriota bacterium]